jgi:putative ABC transport system substrate-binding protein
MTRRELMLLLGGVVTAPSALRAQQKATPVIGFLGSASPGPFAPFLGAFTQGLSEAGYTEGQNVAVEYVGRKATTVDCPHWLPISSGARSI